MKSQAIIALHMYGETNQTLKSKINSKRTYYLNFKIDFGATVEIKIMLNMLSKLSFSISVALLQGAYTAVCVLINKRKAKFYTEAQNR